MLKVDINVQKSCILASDLEYNQLNNHNDHVTTDHVTTVCVSHWVPHLGLCELVNHCRLTVG